MSTYILVHGAWHGGWCWHKVVARLERLGHRVLAPDLPGHGIDRTPPGETTLKSLVDSICALVDGQEEPVTLVGHSYGGTIITQAAEWRPENIRRLVYVAAFIPQNGESTGQLGGGDPDTLLNPEMEVAADRKTVTVRETALKRVFYAQCPDEDMALARALLVPEGLAGIAAPVATTAENWGKVPRRYVECTGDRAIGVGLQRRMVEAAPCEKVFSLKTDHSPFFSMPDELTAALAEA